jgi:uncharacterized membrane protein
MFWTILILCFLIGTVTGLRSMTAPAAVCWGAHLGWLHFAGTKFAFIDHPASLIVFTLFALAELVADKLPKTPARTAPPGLITRMVFGALCAVALAMSAGAALLVAGSAGVVGALVGTFGGYHIRHALVLRAHLPDLAVAVVEDMIAIGGGLLIVAHVSV